MKCQLCGGSDLTEILNLGNQPICNAVLTDAQLTQPEATYPLTVYLCDTCKLLQLKDTAPAKEVFGANYNYLTSSTLTLLNHFEDLANKLTERFGLNSESLVVDIGSNDGTFLSYFKQKGVSVLGVEPTPKPAEIANSLGVTTIQDFFENRNWKNIPEKAHPQLVTAMNVLAHTNNIHLFLTKLHDLMTEQTMFVSQSHYLPALIEQMEYDTIYHEHLRYYTLTTLMQLFEMHGLYIYDAELTSIYGGSIIVYASRIEQTLSEQAKKLLEAETKYLKTETYIAFANQVRSNAAKLKTYLLNLREKGKRIVGVGAPMKASTLLNYCGIDTGILDYITEVNTLKIGKYTPATHIPIVGESILTKYKPDYALILSWNVANDIIASMRKQGFVGGFIIPVPEFHVITEVTQNTDVRGTITDVLTDEYIEHVNHITFAKHAVRGNHYHKKSIHYDYVLKGRLRVYTRLPYGETKIQDITVGDLIFTAPNEHHAVVALEPSEIMVFTRGERGGKHYESDTYRLTGADKLV